MLKEQGVLNTRVLAPDVSRFKEILEENGL